ncbi:hypothetical protein STCU_10121 [Strigomonas culicis]|uniref:ATP-dependent helicase C-terminal domain-containing protein n=1 Tax=Strigomonas culicis TaxID=28005 RepID=S9TP56_9TRYP|nr:hypothetical protein STCU_10121 [Strigomonas culicis]|eukprot:EPY18203.1 hypothetical protein STCU_10121 [Strigomonas culicis]
MRPLTLSCGPLLSGEGEPTTGCASDRDTIDRRVTLIREGHIVPAANLKVLTLCAGPSRCVFNWSHQTLQQAHGQVQERLFGELALTLLNVARCLPPAGAIVFFTSYEMERRFVAYLRGHATVTTAGGSSSAPAYTAVGREVRSQQLLRSD